MNNYEERAQLPPHKRTRMEPDAVPPPPLVQPNGIPINYMDNGHQIAYQPYASSYNAHYPPADVAFGGYGPGGELGYASRSLAYAPPAHQGYPPPPQSSAAAFVQQQQQQMLHPGVSPYEQQHHPQQHAAHKPAWHPQTIMQPLQAAHEQVIKAETKVKQEIKIEPVISLELHGPSVIAMHTTPESHPVMDANSGVGNQLPEDSPKIKIKTDLFKEAEANQIRRGVITDGGEMDKPGNKVDIQNRQSNPTNLVSDGLNKNTDVEIISKDPNMDMLGGPNADIDAAKSRISDSGNSTDSANKNKFPGFSASESSSSSSEDDTKIPNEIYFGTPDISTYRPKMLMTPQSIGISTTPKTTTTPMTGEVKKRGRPKGSCNKPKPLVHDIDVGTPGAPRPQVGRPRGGGHSGSFLTHPIRPFKRDFSGIRFRRRWSDDGLDSSHIPNEVYFGDVPVSMEILFNYYDANAEREKVHSSKVKLKKMHQTPGNVTMVYSSSDSSSDDSSDSDTSDTDNEAVGNQFSLQQPIKRGPGRPRGSKTINRRSDGQRLSSVGSPGDKPPGITEMKKFLKAAGIEYDYNKLVDGSTSNKERVARLLGLLQAKGLQGPPTMEACRALYDGPPPRRRGPKPGTKRTPKTSVSSMNADTPLELTPVTDEDSRRVTRGQTSGKPRQRIVISSDEEDAHTPLSKLRMMRQQQQQLQQQQQQQLQQQQQQQQLDQQQESEQQEQPPQLEQQQQQEQEQQQQQLQQQQQQQLHEQQLQQQQQQQLQQQQLQQQPQPILQEQPIQQLQLPQEQQ